MDKKIDKFFYDTFHNSRNHNAIRDREHYGKPTFLLSSSNGNDLGCSMPLVGVLYDEDGFQEGDELPRQIKTNGCKPHQQLDNIEEESRNNTDTLMVQSECLNKTQVLSLQLGQLLRINNLKGSAWAEEKPCHLVLPNDRPTIWKNKDDASVYQVSASDEIDEVHGYHNNLPIIVDTIMNSNRCNIANLLGFKLHDKDQEDYISYIKEEFIGYIEEVKEYGFNHIIIIGEPYYGMLFLDCFGRVFNLDSMTNTLFFLGDYFKRVEKKAKGLETEWVPWILNSDKEKIVEANGPEHYLISFQKKQIGKIKKECIKKKKKKGSKKKHL
ncbi:hypothetical protein C1645_760224 [Glomus cerebriforme]|uniref:Uncharacterized protein n=1 Tax=Glomus cerebriforme TaxID=658196 RepID=A0A397T7W4_9GLOM|nr:hypothetical protein C1645_760224 [Glomus cerebriforme]